MEAKNLKNFYVKIKGTSGSKKPHTLETYKDICKKYGVPYNGAWRQGSCYYYGVKNGKSAISDKSNTEYCASLGEFSAFCSENLLVIGDYYEIDLGDTKMFGKALTLDVLGSDGSSFRGNSHRISLYTSKNIKFVKEERWCFKSSDRTFKHATTEQIAWLDNCIKNGKFMEQSALDWVTGGIYNIKAKTGSGQWLVRLTRHSKDVVHGTGWLRIDTDTFGGSVYSSRVTYKEPRAATAEEISWFENCEAHEGFKAKRESKRTIKSPFLKGDIVISLTDWQSDRTEGDIIKVFSIAFNGNVYYKKHNNTGKENFRMATDSEKEAFRKGFTNINNIPLISGTNSYAVGQANTTTNFSRKFQAGDRVMLKANTISNFIEQSGGGEGEVLTNSGSSPTWGGNDSIRINWDNGHTNAYSSAYLILLPDAASFGLGGSTRIPEDSTISLLSSPIAQSQGITRLDPVSGAASLSGISSIGGGSSSGDTVRYGEGDLYYRPDLIMPIFGVSSDSKPLFFGDEPPKARDLTIIEDTIDEPTKVYVRKHK